MAGISFSSMRSFLLFFSGLTALINLLLGSYMEEAHFTVGFFQQVAHFIQAKQDFPPVVHEMIEAWDEPLSRQRVVGNNRIIWGYWHEGEENLPGLCQLAVKSWRVHHPDWKIIILSDQNYKTYVSHHDIPSTFHYLKTQHRSDIVRLSVMRRYGGLYLDVSYVLFKNMDELWDRSERNGDLFLTAPLSLPVEDRLEPMAFPNNAFLLTTQPENPVFVAWHMRSLEFLEDPVYTMDEIKEHPVMSRVRKYIGDPAFGPVQHLAPYVCNLWTMADTLYFEPAVRSYVKERVFILPTLMWTFDFVMIDMNSVPASEVPYKIYTSESWVIWLKRIPNGLRAVFGDSKELFDKVVPLGNAMKVSSDLCVWWNKPVEFHLGLKSTMGRVWRFAVDVKAPKRPANLEGIRPLVPFDDEVLQE